MSLHKIGNIIWKTLVGVLLLFIIGGFVLSYAINLIWNYREKLYYSDTNNYISDTAIVDNIIYDEQTGDLYFWLSGISEQYQDSTFKVEGKSVSNIIEHEKYELLEIGDKIEYISAPGYFGDGYCMPIVALSVEGEELLDFQDGYANLLALY